MRTLLVTFWAILIFASIAWYGFLVFHVGRKASREIRDLTRNLAGKK
jgi:hypothetical protein